MKYRRNQKHQTENRRHQKTREATKLIIVLFSDVELRVVEREAKCCWGFDGHLCLTGSLLHLLHLHLASCHSSPGCRQVTRLPFTPVGAQIKNDFVVLPPPSHKHTFACVALRQVITPGGLLERAWPACVAVVCCPPATFRGSCLSWASSCTSGPVLMNSCPPLTLKMQKTLP